MQLSINAKRSGHAMRTGHVHSRHVLLSLYQQFYLSRPAWSEHGVLSINGFKGEVAAGWHVPGSFLDITFTQVLFHKFSATLR